MKKTPDLVKVQFHSIIPKQGFFFITLLLLLIFISIYLKEFSGDLTCLRVVSRHIPGTVDLSPWPGVIL